jgi:hypothetical protein
MKAADPNPRRGVRTPLVAPAAPAWGAALVRLAGTGVLLASIAVAADARGWSAALPAPGDAASRRWALLAVPSLELRAGERVSLAIPEPPPGVEELEVLLSVDGGRSYPVRVTPEMDRSARRVEWLVPNLPASEARLRIRYRLGGWEVEGPPSATFTLRGDARRSQELDLFHEGNWWSGLAAPVGFGPAVRGRADTQIEAVTLAALAESPSPTACCAPPETAAREASRPPRRGPAPTQTEFPEEIFTPLRN